MYTTKPEEPVHIDHVKTYNPTTDPFARSIIHIDVAQNRCIF
jgi:hypothetical protein